MSHRMILLLVHVALLLLASTCFTIVTGFFDGQFTWEYFRYTSRSGWGTPYEFRYSLPVVFVYLAAYAAGAAAYFGIWRGRSPIIGLAGLLFSGVGFASFGFELTHWFVRHNRSWIATAPIVLLILAAAASIQYFRRRAPRGNQSRSRRHARLTVGIHDFLSPGENAPGAILGGQAERRHDATMSD